MQLRPQVVANDLTTRAASETPYDSKLSIILKQVNQIAIKLIEMMKKNQIASKRDSELNKNEKMKDFIFV